MSMYISSGEAMGNYDIGKSTLYSDIEEGYLSFKFNITTLDI
ncbi:MAG: hypothetical protein R3B66_08535 [Candidatus Scalinduaceae bacterium]